MGTLTVQDILAKLGPRPGIALVWDIFLYLVFLLAVIVMFMQSDKQLVPTLMAGAVAAMAVIAKLDVLAPREFGSLIINAGMFVLPMIIAGITQAKKSQVPSVICSVFAGLYFFLFWFVAQR
jgi:hypothetical protein